MNNVIHIDDYKDKQKLKNMYDLQHRIMVIQNSIDRINKLMAELRARK